MVLEIEVNADSVKKLEKFLGTGKYKDLAVNTQSFSRKLNEERKMRIPYVDGQVGTMGNIFCNQIIFFPRLEWPRNITITARELVRECQAPNLDRSTHIHRDGGRRRITSTSNTSCYPAISAIRRRSGPEWRRRNIHPS